MSYLRHRRRRTYRELPSTEDLWEVVEHLERRMDVYELEYLVRRLPLEDVAKAMMLRGLPVSYAERVVEEYVSERWEGLVFKRPVKEVRRIMRERSLTSEGWIE